MSLCSIRSHLPWLLPLPSQDLLLLQGHPGQGLWVLGAPGGLCSRPPPPDPRKNTLVTFPSSLRALAGFRNFVVTEHLGATSVNHLLPGHASK